MLDGPNGARVRTKPDDRIQRITGLAKKLLMDVAGSGYGGQPDLGYLAPSCAAEVARSLDAVTHGDNLVEADYGEWALGTAYLPETGGPVRVELVVDDHSVLRVPSGERTPLPQSRWLVDLALDSQCTQILSLSVRQE